MKSIDKIKLELLRRKINERIIKYPKLESFIIKGSFGPEDTYWKVTRRGRDFDIVEVNTRKEKFILSERDEKEEEPKDKDKKKEKEKEKEDPPEKDSEPDVPAPEPNDVPPPEGDEAGLETDLDVTGPPPEEPGPQRTTTGEEQQLKQLVANKPIQDIQVMPEDSGGIITLQLGSLENPLEIKFDRGEVSYSLGDLTRRLPTSKMK